MSQNIAVVFDNYAQAETAANALRQAGVTDNAMSIIAQQSNTTTVSDGSGETVSEKTGDAVKGAVGGAALGTILGVAALAIPGVGPFIGAGAIAMSAVPGAAVAGAAIGAAGGGLLSLLTDHGVDEADARYFQEHIQNGSTFLSVDLSQTTVPNATISDILYSNGGHSSGVKSIGVTSTTPSQPQSMS